MFSQHMLKSIDPIQSVSLNVLVYSTYWMQAYTHVHTHTHEMQTFLLTLQMNR